MTRSRTRRTLLLTLLLLALAVPAHALPGLSLGGHSSVATGLIVAGAGFGGGERVDIVVHAVQGTNAPVVAAASVTTGRAGQFEWTAIRLPALAQPGTYLVVARGQRSGWQTAQVFTLR